MSGSGEEALQRARVHLQRATLEGLEAARALLQAAVHTSGLANPSGDSRVGSLQRSLEDLIAALRENASFMLPAAFAEPLTAALEAEIKRWERRSQADPDARPVLRAFLGLRELLWELGMRHERQPASEGSPSNSDGHGPTAQRRDRVQRFDIED